MTGSPLSADMLIDLKFTLRNKYRKSRMGDELKYSRLRTKLKMPLVITSGAIVYRLVILILCWGFRLNIWNLCRTV